MNNERVLRVTNAVLLLIGYHQHWYERRSRGHRLSLCGIVHFIIIAMFYMLCVNQHFVKSALLKVLQDVSPFLRCLIRLQLLLGVKIFLFSLYNLRLVLRAASELARVLPRVFARKFSANEAVAYFLLFSTHLIGLAVALYIAYEMEFQLPPIDNILVSLALFIPHFVLGGAVRLFCVGAWLLREEWQQAETELIVLLMEEQQPSPPPKELASDVEIGVIVSATNVCVRRADRDLQKPLLQSLARISQLAEQQRLFNEALQRELLLMFVLNSNCLLAGVYSLVYFESTWSVMFTAALKRIFYAANVSIYVLIGWDWLCVCLSATLYGKVRTAFGRRVELVLRQRKRLGREARIVLKDIRDILAEERCFNFFGILQLSTWNVLRVHVVVGMVIALIVIYHHLNDQIMEIITRLDSNDDDDGK